MEGVRKVKPDFNAVIMEQMGFYSGGLGSSHPNIFSIYFEGVYMKKLAYFLLALSIISFTISSLNSTEFIELEKVAESKVPETLVLPDLGSITVDAQGNVFAFAGKLNGNECFVVKFDPELNYVSRFGREGRGPGEFKVNFSSPEDRLSIDARNGDVYVVDYNPGKLVIFDKNGKHKKDISFQRDFIKQFGYMHQVNMVGPGLFMAERRKSQNPVEAVIFSLDPSEIKVRFPLDTLRINVHVGTTWVQGITEICYGDNHFLENDSKHVVFGNSQKYKFHVYDSLGNLVLKIEDPERKMSSFRKKELNKLGERFDRTKKRNPELFKKLMKQLKTRKNVIADIKLDGERIYVFPVREDITIGNQFPVEVYNMRGKIIKKGFFKKIPDKIWNYFAFYKEYDDEYNPLIIKYKIKESL